MKPFVIRVPASSANLGPAFDSAGLALGLYLTLDVKESDEWEFLHMSPLLPPVDNTGEHFIFQAARQTAEAYSAELPACKVIMSSEIPLARGLGSSASAAVAGIELANRACSLSLSPQDKLMLATQIEGHPDNAAASLYGGLAITALHPDGGVDVFHTTEVQADIVAFIPEFELKTEQARQVLPDRYLRKRAAAASAVSNVMIAALLAGDYELAGRMMEKDLFHEPYRIRLLPGFAEIRAAARELGAYGTAISGAGPALLSLVPAGEGSRLAQALCMQFPHCKPKVLKLDKTGIQVEFPTHCKIAD